MKKKGEGEVPLCPRLSAFDLGESPPPLALFRFDVSIRVYITSPGLMENGDLNKQK